MLIQVLQKVWKSKVQNRYIPPGYLNDIDKGVFDFQQCEKSVYRPKKTWEEVSSTYLITFNDE